MFQTGIRKFYAWPSTGIGGGGGSTSTPPIFNSPTGFPPPPPTGSGGGTTWGPGPILTGMINYSNMTVGYFKINLEDTVTNMYGEALEKWYYPPLSIKCLLERGDQTNPDDEFGVGISQTLTVKITKDSFQAINILPEVGDVLTDQEKYYEVKDVNINIITIPGTTTANPTSGTAGSIILYGLTCYLTRITKLNITEYYQ